MIPHRLVGKRSLLREDTVHDDIVELGGFEPVVQDIGDEEGHARELAAAERHEAIGQVEAVVFQARESAASNILEEVPGPAAEVQRVTGRARRVRSDRA